MKPGRRRSVALLLLLSLLLTGCASGSDSDKSPSTPTDTRIVAPPPDPSTAEGVAVLALREIFSWHPATEPPGVSMLRARQWLGPTLRTVLDTPATGVEAPKTSLQWSQWAAKKADVQAFAFASGEQEPATETPEPPPPPTETDATLTTVVVLRTVLCKIGIEQTVVYPDGRREQLAPTTVIATVVLTSDGWRLDGYR